MFGKRFKCKYIEKERRSYDIISGVKNPIFEITNK